MPSSRLRWTVTPGAVAALAAACGGGGDHVTAPRAVAARAIVVAGGGVRDTVLAKPRQALVLEIRDTTGAVAAGAVAQLTPQPPPDAARQGERGVYVCDARAAGCGYGDASNGYAYYGGAGTLTATADAAGRVTALVSLGSVAGPTYVIVAVPALGIRDSVPFTVDPGAACGVRVAAREVTLVPGGRQTLGAAVEDCSRNTRSEAPTLSLAGASGVASFDANTGTVTGQAMGANVVYARYTTRYGPAVDSTLVHVVPAGRLLAWDAGANVLQLVNTDGSAARLIGTAYGPTFPRFVPGTGAIAFGSNAKQVAATDTLGANRRTWTTLDEIYDTQLSLGYARPLADGTVLAVGQTIAGHYPIGAPIPGGLALFRLDGANRITQIAALPGAWAPFYGGVDVSPDGARVAYVLTDSATGAGGALVVLTVATGQRVTLDALGRSPRWSPAGDQIAYTAQIPYSYNTADPHLFVASADGTGKRALSTSLLGPGIAWSPDAQYLLGAGSSGLRVVRVRDGLEVAFRIPDATRPDGFAAYSQFDWR